MTSRDSADLQGPPRARNGGRRNEELLRRAAFTLGALVVYRLGALIPLPGIDLAVWEGFFRTHADGALGQFNFMSGGAVGRLAIFSLSVTPYIFASVLLQLATIVSRKLRALKHRGISGRAIVDRRTRWLTVMVAALQAYGVARALMDVSGLVADPGWPFVVSTVLTLTGGTMVLVWLSDQITLRGIGNGLALILLTNIVTELPQAIDSTLGLARRGVISSVLVAASIVIVAIFVALVVAVERAQRRLPIRYSWKAGTVMVEGRTSFLAMKLNSAGIIPVVLASWFLLVAITLANIIVWLGPAWFAAIVANFNCGHELYLILYAALIFFFTFFYGAFVLDPQQTAEDLKKHGGTIPTIEPGEATAAHLDHVLSRVVLIGAAYLVLVYLVPEILTAYVGVPFYLGGTSLLVVVCTIIDLLTELHARLLLRPPG